MVKTMTSAVSSVLLVSLAATLASSTASALAASLGAAVGSSSGSGGALPLLFGAQRLSLSSGLAVKKSPMQTGAANGLAWSTGRLGLVRAPTRPKATTTGRSLQSTSSSSTTNAAALTSINTSGNTTLTSSNSEEYEELTPFAELLDVLAFVGLIMALLAVLRLAILVYWTRFANTRYYREARQKKFEESQSPHGHPVHRARLTIRKKNRREKRRPPATFKGLPASLVFPSMEFLVFGIFSAGLTETSVAALCDESCENECVWAAILTLAVMGSALIAGAAQVTHFYLRHCRASWSENAVDAAQAVEDPVLRLISMLRQRCGWSPIGRERGGYEASEEDATEPARTERLLSSPFRLLHSNAGDACDAMGSLWLSRSSGSISGIFYDLFSIALMLSLGVAFGLEDLAAGATWSAVTQAVIVFILQLCLTLYVLMLCPSIDRIDNFQTWLQLLLEACSTLFLLSPLMSGSEPSSNEAKLSSFIALIVALIAVFLPVINKIYDVVVVPLIEWILAGADCRALIAVLVHMICMIPGCVLGWLGCDSADLADAGLEGVSSYTLQGVEEQDEAEDQLEQPVRVSSEPHLLNKPGLEVGTTAMVLGAGANGICKRSVSSTSSHPRKHAAGDIRLELYENDVVKARAAVALQRFARGYRVRRHLKRKLSHFGRSYIHTIIHSQDSNALNETVCSRQCKRLQRSGNAHQWQETAVRAQNAGAIGSSNQDNCMTAAHTSLSINVAELEKASNEASGTVKVRVQTRTRRRVPRASLRPTFSRDVSVVSTKLITELDG